MQKSRTGKNKAPSTGPTISTQASDSKHAKVKITTAEGTEFEVNRQTLHASGILHALLSDVEPDLTASIPLKEVTAPVFERILTYLTHYQEEFSKYPSPEAMYKIHENVNVPLSTWDEEYCKVDQGTLMMLIVAANYLEITPLLNLLTRSASNLFLDKSPQELRETFGVVNDFTPEEEKQVKEENQWAEGF